jgi:hypothetical protein
VSKGGHGLTIQKERNESGRLHFGESDRDCGKSLGRFQLGTTREQGLGVRDFPGAKPLLFLEIIKGKIEKTFQSFRQIFASNVYARQFFS